MKPILSFYTNMPTPYQLDFFSALKEYFDLRVVYFSARESDREWELPSSGNGYSVKVLKNNRLAVFIQKWIPSFHFSWEIISVLKKDRADMMIVNGTYWAPNVLACLFLGKKQKKKLCFWAEPVFPSKGIRFFIKKLLLWPVKHYTDFLLAIGKKAEQGYRAYGYAKPIYNIPYNIDISLFRKENLNQDRFQQLLKKYKPNGETVLLSSGSLIPRKGMDTVIEAFKKATKGDTHKRLLIIGGGPEKLRLEEIIGHDKRIELLGFQEKEWIPYWFCMADIFVFASRYDGWGLVVNEAVASENAIICSTATGAATDALIDGYNAFLADPDDLNGFSGAIEKLIESRDLRDQIVSNANKLKLELSSAYNAKKIYELCSAPE